MTTNSRTWFYNEPEHRPYYVEERVNQTLWANRFGSIYLKCTRAESPFQMQGEWNGIAVTINWVPNQWFTMNASQEDKTLITGFSQVLQMLPAVTYPDQSGQIVTEWVRDRNTVAHRIEEVKAHVPVGQIKTYKR